MKNTEWALIAAILYIVYSFNAYGELRIPFLTTGTTTQPPISTTGTTAAGGVLCPNTLATTLKSRMQNSLNSSLHYIAAPVSYVSADGKVRATETLTAGTAGTWSTGSALTCGESYKAYVINSASYVSSSKDAGIIQKDISYNEMIGTLAGTVIFKMTDSDLNNITTGDADGTAGQWVQDTTTTAQTFGAAAGASFTGYLKVKQNATAAQFGSDEITNYFCLDFDTAVYSKANGVIISGLSESATLPSWCSSNGYDKAYVLPKPIRSTDGEITFSVTIKNDLGAASNKDVKIIAVDGAFYTKTDGTVGSGTADDNLADIGLTNRYVTWNDN